MVYYVYKEEEIDKNLEAEVNTESIKKIKEDVKQVKQMCEDLANWYV